MTLFQHRIQIRHFIIPRTWIQRLRTKWLYSLAVLTGSVNWCPCGRIESWVDALCEAGGKSLAAEQPGHLLVCRSIQKHIHHLQDVIVLVKTPTSVESLGYTAVQHCHRRRREITQRALLCSCWILPVGLYFWRKWEISKTLSPFRSIFPLRT